jgi:hypothetical protein
MIWHIQQEVPALIVGLKVSQLCTAGGGIGILVGYFYSGARGADFMSHLKRLISHRSYAVRTEDTFAATIVTLSTQKCFMGQPM